MGTPTQLQERIESISPKIQTLVDHLNQVLLGKEDLIENVVTGFLAGGHILLEGLPGLGKTELVKGLSRLCTIGSNRVQFTPDLLPSDITGSFILQQKNGSREFEFQEGPIFTHILLADEKSALLEAMAERAVTVMGETRPLPAPFFVMATQNPIELEGTYPLPEAQVDRFLLKLHVHRPSEAVLGEIARNRIQGVPPELKAVIQLEELRDAMRVCQDIYLSEAVAAYIARTVEASHPDSPLAPELVRKYVRYGGSPRAAIGLASAAKAKALMLGRVQAGFDSVKELYPTVMNHRILLDYSARMDGVRSTEIIEAILNSVSELSKPLPAGVKE